MTRRPRIPLKGNLATRLCSHIRIPILRRLVTDYVGAGEGRRRDEAVVQVVGLPTCYGWYWVLVPHRCVPSRRPLSIDDDTVDGAMSCDEGNE